MFVRKTLGVTQQQLKKNCDDIYYLHYSASEVEFEGRYREVSGG
jgi:hypothetical protein